jgi:UDP-glucose 4-epimerase
VLVKVLVTGGAGFIGSTIGSACLDAGIDVVVLDDLSTGEQAFTTGRAFYPGDIADRATVERLLDAHPDIDVVVHCAAKIVVPESVANPLAYYRTNVSGTIALVEALMSRGLRRIVFSSSASMYRPGEDFSVDEESPLDPTSPYAASKMMVERVLEDSSHAYGLRTISLRYFNPVGADPRLRTGLQNARPTHALGMLMSAYRTGDPFTVTGVDWPTRDGSGIRDYVHVWDLAQAHVAALQAFDEVAPLAGAYEVLNVGTGQGTTVRELVAAFSAAVGQDVRTVDAGPRPGDVVGCYTRTEKIQRVLGWGPQRSLVESVRDALAWDERRAAVLGF